MAKFFSCRRFLTNNIQQREIEKKIKKKTQQNKNIQSNLYQNIVAQQTKTSK